MSEALKQAYLAEILPYVHHTNTQDVWPRLEDNLCQFVNNMDNQGALSGSAFARWWQAAASLFANFQIQISALNYRQQDDKDEYIELFNAGPLWVDLSSWVVDAGGKGQQFMFKPGTLIAPGKRIRVYTQTAEEFSFNHHQGVWNNKGDTARVFDAEGNLICCWVYGKEASSSIHISDIMADGKEARTEGDEYIEVENLAIASVDISHWSLDAGHGKTFTFPEETFLLPGQKVRVFTNKIDLASGGYSFGSSQAIWNNHGDIGQLFNAEGELIDKYAYGDKR